MTSNPVAKNLNKFNRPKKIRAKKGRGSYSRKGRGKKRGDKKDD